ncbi:MAG: hypothetical protein QOD42_3209 [Sphingomonadales bacterium]|jgi:hypothetical protein|nr:hypothetical protein [Sphingomonadales bacterium]
MADQPKSFQGIMLSSTFTDLKEHRQKAKLAIEKLGFHAVGMESGGARAADVIDASLRYVRESAAYIGIITKKYGQTPPDPDRNPEERSITELEYDEAMRLDRPILLFIMAGDHKVLEEDIELDPDRRAKLAAFKARAKLMRNEGKVERVWEPFNSLEDFAERVGPAIGNLARELELPDNAAAAAEPSAQDPPLPAAPALRALPPYIGSHDFVGRSAELDVLDDWASPADPHPVLLFEAMGGTGKSMLTWHWLKQRASQVRGDWAGRFWYSFYEQGATLAGFCREALSYMTGLPVKHFAEMRAPELGDRLLAGLDQHHWLLVLDGLERILVGYQRSDAAQLRDEDVESIRDPVAGRDPCLAIRPEDDELLRRLAAVTRSKLLISTRLTPAKLVNKAGQAIPGVKRELLKGLRPPDAEALFRACGVRGDSQAIQTFLQANCDGHPLVIGVLAGLVNEYLPRPGDFAAWRDDPAHGGKLDWAALDLIQRRNHILDAAIVALDPMSLQLLQGLAILIGGADFPLLEAINPHMPARPAEIDEPEPPERHYMWGLWDKDRRDYAQAEYRAALEEHALSRRALAAWQADPAVKAAPRHLAATVRNLEKRGLLQYDSAGRRYDLHPVVRGVASSRMSGDERANSGGRVADYCRAVSPRSWDHAESLEEVALGRQLVATLNRMGRLDEALDVFRGSLANTLRFRLEAGAEIAGLLNDFFPDGWDRLPAVSDPSDQSWLMNEAALVMKAIDPDRACNLGEQALVMNLDNNLRHTISINIANLAVYYDLATQEHLYDLAGAVARANRDEEETFLLLLDEFRLASIIGKSEQAEALWDELSTLDEPTSDAIYRAGDAEVMYAWHCARQGRLSEAVLAEAEQVAAKGGNRKRIRELAELRGRWLMENGQQAAAITSLEHAIAMARAVGQKAVHAEAALALARLRSGDRDGARAGAEALKRWGGVAAFYVGRVWAELGERERAVEAARRAHDTAVGEGEPYVYGWELTRARALLTELGAELPAVPRHDPASLPKFEWEPKLREMIASIEAENAERDAEEEAERLSEEGGTEDGGGKD